MNKNLLDHQIFELLYAVEDLSDLELDDDSESFMDGDEAASAHEAGEAVEVDQLNRVLDETQGIGNLEPMVDDDWDVDDLIPLAGLIRREQRPERFERVWGEGLNMGHVNIIERKISMVNPLPQMGQPIEFFKHLFGDDLIDVLVTQTNIYAYQSNCLFWTPTTHQEMEAFIGLIIYMGLHPQHDVDRYLSSDPLFGVEPVAKVMTSKRYKKLLQNLHLNDNTLDPQGDKLFKIRPMVTMLNERFSGQCTSSSSQSIDECMVKFKGKSSLKQYMPQKPIKRGYKVWARCDSATGYLYQFQVYTGRAEIGENVDGLGHRVVATLCENVPENTLVAFDNFFTGCEIMDYLYERKIFAVGTVRSNRKGLPEMIKKGGKTKLKKNEHQWSTSPPISAISWMDTKVVNVLTTAFDPSVIEIVKRRQKDGSLKEIECPAAVAEYSRNMGGVDHFDHFGASYPVGRKSRRNWMRLFHFMLDAAIINAYIQICILNGKVIASFG